MRCAVLAMAVALAGGAVPSAAGAAPSPSVSGASPPPVAEALHPAVTLRDEQGKTVLGDRSLVSPAKSCGGCHDVDYIASHDSHRELGVEASCFDCHLGGAPEALGTESFDNAGRLTAAPSPPDCNNCGGCHGQVHQDQAFLEILPEIQGGAIPGPFGRSLLTGEIYSPQTRSASFLNLEHKQQLVYPWDVHAERGVHCTSCHFPANDPARADLIARAGPSHLIRDPRTLAMAAYLAKPDHRLATASCTACHDPSPAHRGLPYPERHLATLACQACHVQTLHGPALAWQDRTAVTAAGGPRVELRGVDGEDGPYPNTWFYRGYSPVLLHETEDGGDRLAPYNPVTTWRWVAGEGSSPVPDELVRRAWLAEDGSYRPEILRALDGDQDGRLAPGELVLDTDAKVTLLRARLVALGVSVPRISGSIELNPVRHGVVAGKWVAQECMSCHGADSRLNVPVELATGPWPGGVVPTLDGDAATLLGGRTVSEAGGRLRLVGDVEPPGHYILGHSRRPWSDRLGFWLFFFTALGVAMHGTARWVASRRRGPVDVGHPAGQVYMYNAAERLWHWTMAASVILLLLSGLTIHYPQGLAWIGMRSAVFVHNLFAGVLLITAFLSILVHVATGEVRQYIPKGAGLVQRLRIQAQFYLKGIFVGASHPFAKRRAQKLNPLQQLTYTGLLNVLLPFQVLSGILLWVAGMAPDITFKFGGLSVVAPLHNLGSWLFLAFVVVHVYLTTTGHSLTSNIKAMATGWDVDEGSSTARPTTDGVNS